MKKTLILLSMAAALAGQAQPYGEKLYPHGGTFCSSGALTAVNTPGTQGFITSGIVPVAAVGTPNYFIDKTGPGGLFAPAAAFPFSNSYMVSGDKMCSTAPPQAQQMIGTDVIEANAAVSTVGGWYAKAGVFEHGVFFSMLNNAGIPVTQGFYPFPLNATGATRPTIIASPIIVNEYYICGSYVVNGVNNFYMLNVKETGTPAGAGSRVYIYPPVTANVSVIPNDMMASPYFGNEIVVVGQVVNPFGSGSGSRGFLIRIDATTLNLFSGFQLWGQPVTTTGTSFFSSITRAVSPSNGGNGYAIGGFTDALGSANGFVWALKVDPTGTIQRWNRVIRPVTDNNARSMIAIKERNNAGVFTYFGAVIAGSGMMVLKLDNNGIPFVGAGILNFNEFVFPSPIAPRAVVRDLTLINTGAATDVGIQVYGTAPATGGNHYFVESTFNGVSEFINCPTSSHVTGATWLNGPPYLQQRDPIVQAGLVYCQSFNIVTTALNQLVQTLCNSVGLPGGGTNAKPALATGIDAQENGTNLFSVSPNPVSNKLEIKFTANENDAVDIKLFDYTGRLIYVAPVTNGTTGVVGIDMSTLNIESGIYIINATVNGVSAQQKIIYTK